MPKPNPNIYAQNSPMLTSWKLVMSQRFYSAKSRHCCGRL